MRTNRTDPFPVSPAQERLYFLHRLQPDNPAYNITACFDVQGDLDSLVLQSCLDLLVVRHEMLRTAFAVRGGLPVQIVAPRATATLKTLDLRELPEAERKVRIDEVVQSMAAHTFDLSKLPLIQWALIKVEPQRCLVVLTVHHIVFDGRSVGVLMRELRDLYARLLQGPDYPAPALPPVLQYGDYALWTREPLREKTTAEAIRYWQAKLENSSRSLELQTDFPRPATMPSDGLVYRTTVPTATANAVRRWARDQHSTPFMAWLTVFKALLRRYTHATDIRVGTPVDNRTKPEFEQMIGLFVNTLVLRTQSAPEVTANGLLQEVRQTVLEAHDHSSLPFERLLSIVPQDRSLGRSPLFQATFTYEATSADLRWETTSAAAKFDIALFIWEEGDTFGLSLEYSPSLFEQKTIAAMAVNLTMLAEGMAANPDAAIGELPMLASAERRVLLGWGERSGEAFPEGCAHEWVAQQAKLHPGKMAVVCGDECLTYAKLDQRSNLVARKLREMGVTPNRLVGICVERSVGMVVALLGVWKAGAGYLPLDPEFPQDRLRFMLDDSEAVVVIAEVHLLDVVGKDRDNVVLLESLLDGRSADESLPATATAEDVAYVIYTSGSTGQPKGVEVPHRALMNFLASMQKEPGITEKDLLLAVTTLSFDIAGLELWLPLTTGAQVTLAPRYAAGNGNDLAELLKSSQATVMQATPVSWRLLLESGWKNGHGLKVLCGGEALPRELANRLIDTGAEVWNVYGPTETTVWSTVQRVKNVTSSVTPIGKPIANTTVYLVDANLQLVPRGVTGELLIGGAGLARGYWKRPALTAECFIASPFHAGEKLYRTGDQARWRADGTLEYLGRGDTQVKVRGHRIELGEIESVLEQQPSVQHAAVIVREDTPGDQRITAYIVSRNGAPIEARDLREALSAKLPDYMVPQVYVLLDQLPLTPNKKVDRKALPAPTYTEHEREPVAPRNLLETQLLTTWKQVLEMDAIGVEDNFFELGGHSLLAINLFAQLRPALGELPVSLLFEAPTVAEMARKLNQGGLKPRWKSLVAMRSSGTRPPLFLIPGVHGNIIYCAKLAFALGQNQPLYGLHSVGLDGREPPIEAIEKIAAHFVSEMQSVQPHGPYHLAGVCMGGTVAFEMARQLRQRGERVASLVLIETWMPESVRAKKRGTSGAYRTAAFLWKRATQHVQAIQEAQGRDRMRYVVRLSKLIREAIARKQMHDSFRHEMKEQALIFANFAAMAHYEPQPYDGRVTLILADSAEIDPEVDPRLRWAALSQESEIHRLEGANAGVLMREPMVEHLADCLISIIDACASCQEPVAQ
jgi:amino acid adenylation domain-containing protein